MLDDMNGRFTSLTRNFIPDLSFTNSHYTGQFTRAAYYLLLMGSIFAALAMITYVILAMMTLLLILHVLINRGIPKRTYTFLLSTMFAILGTGLLFIGCVIYTVVINKMKDVNRANVRIGSRNQHDMSCLTNPSDRSPTRKRVLLRHLELPLVLGHRSGCFGLALFAYFCQ